MTMPSLAKMPTHVPALLIASMAYSTWCNRPSGENVVVDESYRRAMGLSAVGEWKTDRCVGGGGVLLNISMEMNRRRPKEKTVFRLFGQF